MNEENITPAADDFDGLLSYSDLGLSPENVLILKDLRKTHPNIKKELINETKNHMMNQMFKEGYNEQYTKGVVDTLKYMSRYL